MYTKYLNDGLVGNNKLKVSFSKKGELLRLLYGSADFKQFIELFHTGVKINDSALIYLHEDINNTYSQKYIENTNVLQTNIYNSYFNVNIEQTDFVPITENVLVKNYKIKNENTIDLKINFLAYSKILTNLNNDTSGYVRNNTLLQYNHDFCVCTFSNINMLSKQINGASNDIYKGVIGGKDYIGMSPDSAISYDLNILKPGEEKEITLYIYVNENCQKYILDELDNEINRIRNLNIEYLKQYTMNYWRKFVEEHDILKINQKELSNKIKDIYNRSILLFPLLINEKTGGVSAGIEVDEFKTKCGRYSYCWPRDAVFITEAFEIVGMYDAAEKFYSSFCKMTQNGNGMWEQRFYTDGRLAPSWGYQIDETASVIFGSYAHYNVFKNKEFLKQNLKMFESAIDFLERYIDDLLEQKGEFQLSYDLWEEFEGVSLYSISSIFAAFNSMINIYKEIIETNILEYDYIQNRINNLEKRKLDIKEYCLKEFYDYNKNSFVRNIVDKRMDISILGAIVPFKMFSPENELVKNTIARINSILRTYTGGYIRYENDGYINGNPWPIATLWMSWYYLEIGDNNKALECFNFVVNSASQHGLLGEQVNNEKMEPCWVIGLTWSHAMYILTLEKLIQKGLL